MLGPYSQETLRATENRKGSKAMLLDSLATSRNAEEQQTWEDLLHRFPRSAYQPAAVKRLGELRH